MKWFTLGLLFGLSTASLHDIYRGLRYFKVIATFDLSTNSNCRDKVFELVFNEESQLTFFRDYEAVKLLDVLGDPILGLRNGTVRVTPAQQEDFVEEMRRNDIELRVVINDVAEYLEEFDLSMQRYRSQKIGRILPFQDYPRYAEVDAYMVQMAQQYPNLVTVVSAGLSWEGRDIKYLRISTTNFADSTKPIVFLDAMIHAREWVTTPVTIYAIHRLVEDLLSEDQDLLDNIDWIIMPIVNPDGYEYTHTTARLWRKTRSNNHTDADSCPGVDANRNFDIAFNTVGVSANPCGETYPGPFANSEPEVAYVSNIMLENVNRIQLYINIHSYGNYVLFGYGSSAVLPSNGVQLHFVGASMGAAMDRHKIPVAPFYLVGNSGLVLYQTSGSAQDYGQAVGIPFSYTYELPGYSFAFQVPAEYIDQINFETWEGIKVGARLSVLYYRDRISANLY